MTAPDAFGRGTLVLSVGVDFAYYAVQGQVLRIIETDAPSLVTGGAMFGQGDAGVGGTFSNASLTGKLTSSPRPGGRPSGRWPWPASFRRTGPAIFRPASPTSTIGGRASPPIAGQSRYAIAGNGVGTLTLPPQVDQRGSVAALLIFAVSPDLNLFDPTSAAGAAGRSSWTNDAGAVASGFIVPQSAGVFEGNYAVNLQFVDSAGETDWVGQSVASGGALTGTVDVNEGGSTFAGLAFTGAFTADAANVGRWTGTFTVNGVIHQITYYQVSGTLLVIVDTDAADVGIGILEKE